ncbi:MAG TPA: C69 family dipeptidase [Limnochordales bacterium]
MDTIPSCDTFLARGAATVDGRTLFAKNSDRPETERQQYVIVPPMEHPPGAALHVQYITIPQVRETYGFVGAQPRWLWGLEHGVNQWGLAVGNEAIYTRLPPQEKGLLGMDLVRLALERARTAREAVDVIGRLVEEYGVGGSAYNPGPVYYDNAFLLVDPQDAWHLETAGRHWVARRLTEDRYAISNEPSICHQWNVSSPGLEQFLRRLAAGGDALSAAAAAPQTTTAGASAAGADPGGQVGEAAQQGPYSFAATVLDRRRPRGQATCRRGRGLELLGRGTVDVVGMMALLRDHYEGTPLGAWPPEELDIKSICMHSTPYHPVRTAGSIVAELDPAGRQPPVLWLSVGMPCRSIFLPFRMPVGGAENGLSGSPVSRFGGWPSEPLLLPTGPWDGVAARIAEASPEERRELRARVNALESCWSRDPASWPAWGQLLRQGVDIHG